MTRCSPPKQDGTFANGGPDEKSRIKTDHKQKGLSKPAMPCLGSPLLVLKTNLRIVAKAV